MATYTVVRDDHAGWNTFGRNFSLLCAAVAAIGLLSWLALHGHLGAFQPNAASDQVFLIGLVWLGAGAFCLMALMSIGSISLSLESRGSVNITGEGVSRTIGSRTYSLVWSDIEGYTLVPNGGITLISARGKSNMVIPRFLDDYRACMVEIKDHGIRGLSPNDLRQKKLKIPGKLSWLNTVQISFIVLFCTLATGSDMSHHVRIAGFIAFIAVMLWGVHDDWAKPNATASRWIGIVGLLGFVLYVLWRMSVAW